MSEMPVNEFFDALTDGYTEAIERCFPRYREMLWALLDYLPRAHTNRSILELGCGTGNLSVLLDRAFPSASLRLVDVSGESLDVCRSRLGSGDRFAVERRDFRDLEYENGSFDLIVSSISIHHLDSPEKQLLFRNISNWLSDEGVFSYADQFAGATDDLYARHMHNWKELSLGAGSSEAEWEMWMQHQSAHDHHDTLAEQFHWLSEAGFSIIDCPWRYLLWSVVQARKRAVP